MKSNPPIKFSELFLPNGGEPLPSLELLWALCPILKYKFTLDAPILLLKFLDDVRIAGGDKRYVLVGKLDLPQVLHDEFTFGVPGSARAMLRVLECDEPSASVNAGLNDCRVELHLPKRWPGYIVYAVTWSTHDEMYVMKQAG